MYTFEIILKFPLQEGSALVFPSLSSMRECNIEVSRDQNWEFATMCPYQYWGEWGTERAVERKLEEP